MEDIKLSLYIKYGLSEKPNDEQIKEWRIKTLELIEQGIEKEKAGFQSAKLIFTGVMSHARLSKADDIETLLALALKKVQNG